MSLQMGMWPLQVFFFSVCIMPCRAHANSNNGFHGRLKSQNFQLLDVSFVAYLEICKPDQKEQIADIQCEVGLRVECQRH